ncbi:FecR domain-containing protein [Candidatus Gracilibacteria bacterium]|nr:FecR domain-containing protein [Candidatus Gracilibacteria bacterium]
MKINKKGFSIIEIIITISILIIISIVAVTYMEGSKDKANNSKITSDIETIKNSLLSFQSQSNTLPKPSGNLKFFNLDGNYSHTLEDSDTFGVSGYIGEGVFEKKFLDKIPLDPRTNQFYAYGKTKNYNGFQIAGIISNNYEPRVKLTSNWNGLIQDNKNFSPYIIREYNGPLFVTDNSIKNYPYNPQEKLLTAKIDSFSGKILINGKNESDILNYTLKEGDNLEVSQNGFVNLYYSDGSYSMIGDNSTDSKINFKNMRFIEDNSLFTSVKITLNLGSIWTKAVKLDDKSEFEVYTPNAVAAVRGTIFGVSYNSNTTDVVVKEGIVEVKKIMHNGSTSQGVLINDPVNNITNGIIEVKKGVDEKGISIYGDKGNETRVNTGSILNIPNSVKDEVLNNIQKTTINLDLNKKLKNDEEIDDISYITGTGSNDLINLYKEVLNKTPNKDEFDYWMGDSGFITKISKKDFLNEGYFNYLNGDEKYFNPKYICEAQNSFQVKNECIENTLFKTNKNWKVTQFLPLDEDLKYYDSNGGSGSETGSNSLNNQSVVFSESSLLSRKILSNLDIYKLTNKNGEVTKGLYIDNKNNVGTDNANDYLIYTFGSGFNLNYSIEVSVRGGALKRSSDNYYLYSLSGSSLKLYNNNSKFYLSFGNGSNLSKIYMGIDVNNKLENDRFYKVISTCIDNKANIYIYDNNKLIKSGENTGECQNSLGGNDIYIGSDNNQTNQWNDIIDYVKIYTLDTTPKYGGD